MEKPEGGTPGKDKATSALKWKTFPQSLSSFLDAFEESLSRETGS